MNIVVCVKHVPDSTADRRFEADGTVDRVGVDGLLSELDEYAVEQSLQIREERWRRQRQSVTRAHRRAGAGRRRDPQVAADGRRHGRARPRRRDRRLRRAATAWCSPRRCGRLERRPRGVRDGVHRRRRWACAGDARRAARRARGDPAPARSRRSTPHGSGSAATATPRRCSSRRTLPAVLSVTDQTGEPRYPSFKGIMAAKKKPVETWSLADLGVDADQVGLLPRPVGRGGHPGPPAAHRRRDRHRRRRRRRQGARRLPRRPALHLTRPHSHWHPKQETRMS